MPTWLLGWQGYAIGGLLIAIVAGGGGMCLEGTIKQHEIDGLKLAEETQAYKDADAALTQFEKDVTSINNAANTYQSDKEHMDAKFAKISKEFSDAIKADPLPIDCKPGPIRLHHLSVAVQAANDTAIGKQPVPVVRGNP